MTYHGRIKDGAESSIQGSRSLGGEFLEKIRNANAPA
jgi:hypothetical protein